MAAYYGEYVGNVPKKGMRSLSSMEEEAEKSARGAVAWELFGYNVGVVVLNRPSCPPLKLPHLLDHFQLDMSEHDVRSKPEVERITHRCYMQRRRLF